MTTKLSEQEPLRFSSRGIYISMYSLPDMAHVYKECPSEFCSSDTVNKMLSLPSYLAQRKESTYG